MEKKVVHRKLELIREMAENGNIATIAERAALWSATKILIDEVIEYLTSPEARTAYSEGRTFLQDSVVGHAKDVRAYAGYYYGFGDYDDLEVGNGLDNLLKRIISVQDNTPVK